MRGCLEAPSLAPPSALQYSWVTCHGGETVMNFTAEEVSVLTPVLVQQPWEDQGQTLHKQMPVRLAEQV